jgi:hypothetical protein
MNSHHNHAQIIYTKVLKLLSAMTQNLPLYYSFDKVLNCKITFFLLYTDILHLNIKMVLYLL